MLAYLLLSNDFVGGNAWRRTFKLEGEVVGQMSALMVSSQEEKGIGVPYFQRP